ncbi:hypothetical protein [Halorubrum sp. HHNYT27]|uniref:hypothetical protein n=1 Tax=Halorubrum sp. HHNYT27 TaxID=3402275 RepID=UPI003EBF4DC2
MSDRSAADRREIERLNAELERKEEQLRCVTEQYELLLAEKNRKLANASDASTGPDRRTTRRSRLVQFISSLR